MPGKKDDDQALIKKCMGRNPPSYLLPEFQRIIEIRRVELFPPSYGLSKRGTPDGGFYTFVNDPDNIQKFLTATHKIFFPLETPSIIGDLFPQSCYSQLAFLTDATWGLLPTQDLTKLSPPSKKVIGGYITGNTSSWRDLKKCYTKKGVTRVGVNLLSVDSSGNYIKGRSFSLVFSPGTKPEVVVIDPDSSGNVAYDKVIESVSRNLGIGEYHLGKPSHQKVCKKIFKGQEELCSTWNMFLILTEMMNPPKWWPRIEDEFSNMTEGEMVRTLYQFAWWFIKMFGDVIYQNQGASKEITYEQMIRLTQVQRHTNLPKVEW